MPCNGLVYAPPHSCACYMEAKLDGLCALAPERSVKDGERSVKPADRLESGPAYASSELQSPAPKAGMISRLPYEPTHLIIVMRSK